MDEELIVGKIFGEKNMVSIIIFLYLYGPRTKTEIYNQISKNPRMPIKLDLLERYGLISKNDDHPTGRKVMCLTELGERYARSLESLEKHSGGDLTWYKWGRLNAMMDRFVREP